MWLISLIMATHFNGFFLRIPFPWHRFPHLFYRIFISQIPILSNFIATNSNVITPMFSLLWLINYKIIIIYVSTFFVFMMFYKFGTKKNKIIGIRLSEDSIRIKFGEIRIRKQKRKKSLKWEKEIRSIYLIYS